MRPGVHALLACLALVPGVAAHGTEHGLDEQLVKEGERLMLGEFDAPQPGPLLVVPYVDGPLSCDGATADYVVPFTGESGVAFVSNATHVLATFELAGPGFVAFAVDTHDSSRALLLMQEHAVSIHYVAASAAPPANASAAPELRSGVLGIPYALPGAGMHRLAHSPEGGGIALDYDAEAEGASLCPVAADGHRVLLSIERSRLRDSLVPGRVTHAVALYDPRVPVFLPRPVDSTLVVQANLYWARPGEDPEAVRAALAGGSGWHEWLPLGALALVSVGLLRRR